MERKELFKRAKELGLKVSASMKSVDLEDLVEEAEIAAKAATYDTLPPEEVKKEVEGVKAETAKPAAKPSKGSIRREALRMIRCIITPLDERQRALPSELYSVGNQHIGFIKKVVRFNTETLEPNIIVENLKSRKMLLQTTTMVNGKPKTTKREVPSFAIQVLPDFTEEEFEALKENK